ncbi:hypothetical protein [Streptomyces sp. NPDC051364]
MPPAPDGLVLTVEQVADSILFALTSPSASTSTTFSSGPPADELTGRIVR